MRSYALQDLDTVVHGRAYHEDLRLRFDVLTKTKPPALCRYWTQRDRGPACSSSAWRRCCGPSRRAWSDQNPGLAMQEPPVPEPVLSMALNPRMAPECPDQHR